MPFPSHWFAPIIDHMRRNPIYTARARELRRNANDAEKLLWSRLRGGRLNGHKFRRQHALGDYIGDFVCLGASLVIELDGDTHGSDLRQKLDGRRTETIERQGFRVIRFWNDEVFSNTDGVVEAIWNALHSEIPFAYRGPNGPNSRLLTHQPDRPEV